MSGAKRAVLLCFLSIVLSLLLSGCYLRNLIGNVIIVESIADEVDEIFAHISSDSTAAVCQKSEFGLYGCTYIIDGDIIASTFYLLSELGIFGVVVDPVILQVPDDVTGVTATYDDGAGAKPLSIWQTGSFQATPDITVQAETGHKFIILELPPAVIDQLPGGDPSNGMQLDYALSYKRVQPTGAPIDPVVVKIMLAGKVVVNRHNYYVPILPCVTDFSLIPELEIPVSNSPVELQTAVGALLQGANAACDHQGYYFDNAPPPPETVFLPLVPR